MTEITLERKEQIHNLIAQHVFKQSDFHYRDKDPSYTAK